MVSYSPHNAQYNCLYVCTTGIDGAVDEYSHNLKFSLGTVFFHWFHTDSCPTTVSEVTVRNFEISQTVELCDKQSNRVSSHRVSFINSTIDIGLGKNCDRSNAVNLDSCFVSSSSSFTSSISSVYQVPSIHSSIAFSPSFITSSSFSHPALHISETLSHSSHLDSDSTSSSVILQSSPLSVTSDSSFNPNSFISTSFSTTFLTATPLYYTSMFSLSPSPSSLLYCFAEGNWPLTKAGDTANGTCYKGAFNG